MMWFFLLSDAFTFAAFLTTYGLIRHKHVVYVGTPEAFKFSARATGPFRTRCSTPSPACTA